MCDGSWRNSGNGCGRRCGNGWSARAGFSNLFRRLRQQEPASRDDTTLKRTAVAYVKVQNITLKAHELLKHTNDEAKRGQIIKQAESEKIEAVRQFGIEPQQYNRVILLVHNNDQLRLQRKFLSYVIHRVRHLRGADAAVVGAAAGFADCVLADHDLNRMRLRAG